MCEANVYLADPEGGETLVLESVDKVVPEGPDNWRLTSIFGEQKVVVGRIRSMNLVDHRIIFENAAIEPG
ncbi:CooT family nickel-binding protein [Deltaproteobacteria bacterium OttesenSCG-928-M10]|nr:CooT family nickel-binding protein [Deltaproteobacteria bacterium OttesenSCG-928-M10]